MNYPSEIWADTDLVCSDEAKEGYEKYVRADEHERLFAAVNNLVQIVEGVRNVRWAYENFRLVDTPEWCALYTAWSRDRMPDAKPANDGTQRPGSPDGSLATETRKPGSLK